MNNQQTDNMVKLQTLKRNEKFKWNGHTYTVYQQEHNMIEVYGNGRFWAWPGWTMVEKINYNQYENR